MYVYLNTKARSFNHCHSGKAVSITYSVCVSVAFVFMHAKRMRRIILPYFSTLSHKRYDFPGKCYRIQNLCLDFHYKFCLKHFSFRQEVCEM